MKKKEKGVWVTQAQVKLTGSPDIARFLAQCVYWSENKKAKQRSGWFYKTRDEWKAETWLSRFKQEKARRKLKALGILQERHERRNDGIRLWYRINTGLLNALLNTLDQQAASEYPPVCMDVRSINTGIKEQKNINTEEGSELTELHSVDDSQNTVNNFFYAGFSSTNVPDNNTTDSPQTQHYSLKPQDYVFCHVFIYQFVKNRLPRLSPSLQLLWQVYGLDHHDVFDALCGFIGEHGAAMTGWYRQHVAVEVQPLSADDVEFCQLAGRGIYESA